MGWNTKTISDMSLAKKIYHERNPKAKKEYEEYLYKRRKWYCPNEEDKKRVLKDAEDARAGFDMMGY